MKSMRTELKYGVIIGVLNMFYILGEYMLGYHTEKIDQHPTVTMFALFIPIIGMYFGLKEKRDKDLGGYLTYWQGVKSGLKISFVIGILGACFQFLYQEIINPEFNDTMVAFSRQQALEAGMEKEAVEEAVEAARAYFNTTSYMLQSFFGALVFGLLIALVESAFLKRKENAEGN